tara:strand:+ start:120 stop:533 length:414 start_codon:yes stop_codon:yes gene_type:complete
MAKELKVEIKEKPLRDSTRELLESVDRIYKTVAEDKRQGLLEMEIDKAIKRGKPDRKTRNPGKGGKGNVVSLKDGGDFPDLSGDGKVTQKDILIGKGVIKKKDGGLAEATAKLKAKGFKNGGLAGRLAKRGYGKARK